MRGLLDTFYERYPRPLRHALPVESPERWNAGSFYVRHQEEYRTTLNWSQPELIDYLITLSNVVAALAEGKDTIEETRHWLGEKTKAPFAAATEVPFAFSGPILIVQREA